MARPTTTNNSTQKASHTDLPSPAKEVKPVQPFASNVRLDPDHLLSEDIRNQFQQTLHKFNPDIPGYNGTAGPIQAHVNMGPVEPPQRKGRLPNYSRNQLTELQEKFDELEKADVFKKPEDIGASVEYLNPSFLIKKPSGSHIFVTAFEDVGRYSKP